MTMIGQAFVQVRPDTSTFEKEASGRIGGALKRVAVVAAAAFAASGAKEFLSESVQGYREHNKLLKVTEQVIKTTGGAARISAKGVNDLADAVERKTGVDGDAIVSGENLLLTFTNVRNAAGKGNDVFNRSTQLLADMSVALGQDAKGSAIQLGKALNDPVKGVTALSRVGVSFDAQQQKAIKTAVAHGKVLDAQKIILKELSKEFGGAAAAQMDNSDKQTVAFRALQDAVGAQLLPVLDKLQGFMATKVLPTLTDLVEREGPKAAAFFSGAAQAADVFFGALSGHSELNEFDGKLKTINNAGVSLNELLAKVAPTVKGFFSNLKGADTSTLKDALSSVVDSVVKLGPTIKDAAASLPAFDDSISMGAKVLGFFADHADLVSKALPFIIAGIVAVKAAQVANNAVGRNSIIGFGLQTVATFALAASQRSLAAAMRAQTVATATSNATGNVSILTRARQAVATVASTVAEKAAAVASKAWAAAQWVLNAALDANPISLVIIAIAALVAGIIIAYKKSETFRNIVQAVAQAVVGYFKLMASFWLLVVSAILTGLSKLLAPLANLPGKLGAPFRAAKGAVDAARGAVDDLRSSIAGTKGKNVAVTVTTPGADAAITKLAALRWQTNHIDPTVTIRAAVRAGRAADPGGNALGNPYWRGGLTRVGENGPELVDLPRGSRVFNHDKTREMERQYGRRATAPSMSFGDVYTQSPERFFKEADQRRAEYEALHPTFD